jgi:two-component system sensor histidine kinase KdpD
MPADVEPAEIGPPAVQPAPAPGGRPRGAPPRAYGLGALVLILTTLLALVVDRYFGLTEVIMVYLLGIVLSALRYGRGPALLTSALSVAAFNFLFVPPRYTFAVADARYLFTFVGMFVIGLVISDLTARVRWQADMAVRREQDTSALYGLTRALSRERDSAALAARAATQLAALFRCQVMVLLPGGRSAAGLSGRGPELEPVACTDGSFTLDESERELASWVFAHDRPAGLGTQTRPAHPSLHLPLSATTPCLGVLAVRPNEAGALLEPSRRRLLHRSCDQIALALERALWAEEAQRTALRAEKESLRNTLLSSVSHDLRTPLAAIAGAASTLLDQDARPAPGRDAAGRMTPGQRRELLATICEEAEHLNRLVRNLLDMTRLSFGGLLLRKEWVPLGEVVGSALNRIEHRLGQHGVSVSLPPELPLLPMDPVLLEQLFNNLLENAIRHTPPGTPIEISAAAAPNMVTVAVADRGPGIPPDSEEQVFEKFFRGPYRHSGGVGLGLTICRGIVEAHGGQISAANRSGGGAVFCFTLPIEGEPPKVPPEGPSDGSAEGSTERAAEPTTERSTERSTDQAEPAGPQGATSR